MILSVKLLQAPGIVLEFSDGTRLGNPDDPQDCAIAAGQLRRVLERQLSVWPIELSAFKTPEDRRTLLKAWHQTGTEHELLRNLLGDSRANLHLTPLLKPYLLTQTLGSSLDGSFTTLLPVGSESPQLLEIHSETEHGSRAWQVSAASYRETVLAFLCSMENRVS